MKFFKTIFITLTLLLTLGDVHAHRTRNDVFNPNNYFTPKSDKRFYSHTKNNYTRDYDYTHNNNKPKNDHLMTKLHYAALGERLYEIERLLKLKANREEINAKNTQRKTPLHFAVIKLKKYNVQSQLRMIKLLIDHGADVNAQMDDGSTPLHIATPKGEIEVITYLLERKTNVMLTKTMSRNKRKGIKENVTALHAAMLGNKKPEKIQLQIIQRIIEYAEKQNKKEELINARMSDGSTALHIALAQRKEKCAEFLLQCGTNITLTCTMPVTKHHQVAKENATYLHTALLNNLPLRIIKAIIKEAKRQKKRRRLINAQMSDGTTALHLAVTLGREDVVKYLLKKKANTSLTYTMVSTRKNLIEKKYVTALHAALLSNQSLKMIRLLITYAEKQNKKAELINATMHNGQTALHIAANKGRRNVLIYLLENEAYVTKTSSIEATEEFPIRMKKITPLHAALMSKQSYDVIEPIVEYAQKLLTKEKFKQFINAQTSNGDSALHIAATQNQEKIVAYLLEKDASLSLETFIPKKDKMKEMKNITTLHNALLSNQPICIIKQLVTHAKKRYNKKEYYSFINARTNDDSTPLSIAVTQAQKETILYLLEHGADPNLQTHGKTSQDKIRSPFQMLFRIHKKSAIKEDNPDAHRYTSKEICELIPHFLKHGARIDLTNKYNQSVLYWIICPQLTKELKVLIENSSQENNLYEALKITANDLIKARRFGKTIWDTLKIFYHPKIITTLITTKNKDGKTLLNIAQEKTIKWFDNNPEDEIILSKLLLFQKTLLLCNRQHRSANFFKDYREEKEWFIKTYESIEKGYLI